MVAASMVGMGDAVRGWQVSERTLRRRLRTGVPGADRADDGSWLLPRDWLDTEFQPAPFDQPTPSPPTETSDPGAEPGAGDGITIDLRDPAVADGLAQMLSEFTTMATKTVEAETRAAVADHHRQALAAQLDASRRDHEHESAERQRLEHDLSEARRALAVQDLRIEHLEETLGRERADRAARLAHAEQRLTELDTETRQLTTAVLAYEAVASRRARRRFRRVVDEAERGWGSSGPTH